MRTLETDYLVVGAGAIGMAFTDTILDETDAHITIVDRYSQPGGHWTKAYPFVRLHQPSAYYGVASRPLGTNRRHTDGLNAGMYELASAHEIVAYYGLVMDERFLPSGRVTYLPMTEHREGGRLVSLVSGEESKTAVRRRRVDATFTDTAIPATHAPRYQIGDGVTVVTPNRLPDAMRDRSDRAAPIVIIGGGKTAVDVALWLLGAGLPQNRIIWVMPRDPWFFDRVTTQPGLAFFDDALGTYADRLEQFGRASSFNDLFAGLERTGGLMRLDPAIEPNMFHAATVSGAELDRLRTIKAIVRMGRVQSIDTHEIVLERGRMAAFAEMLVVDCSASALPKKPNVPVFSPDCITPQFVRAPFAAFSASLIAYVEARFDDDVVTNELCTPVPSPDRPKDFAAMMVQNLLNEIAWALQPHLKGWIRANRLDAFASTVASIDPDDVGKRGVLKRIQQAMSPAIINLTRLMASRN